MSVSVISFRRSGGDWGCGWTKEWGESLALLLGGASVVCLGPALRSRRSHLGLVAPISVNFNHQLAYFADQSVTTHVPHQPTAVA